MAAFILFAGAFYTLERSEFVFFDEMQDREEADVARAQAELVRAQMAVARSALVREHGAGHVALASVLSNSLWDKHFGPLVTRAKAMPAALGVGPRIRGLPGFADMDRAVHAAMKGSNVFKIKVYDLRGLTVYSSELAQVGEDKSGNQGWREAVAGTPASEFVHRDRFSTFEGVIGNRDLIQSYIPVYRGSGEVIGVFEIYSDATDLLASLSDAAQTAAAIAAANLAGVKEASKASRRLAEANSARHFIIVFALLALFYLVLHTLVRRGQSIIDRETAARQAATLREQNWHREKMAALATLAANASHEIGNPLAIIAGLAEDLERAVKQGEPLRSHSKGILEQTWRIAAMTRRITEFATARGDKAEPVDVNEMIQAVRQFLSFDKRYRLTWVEEQLEPDLPLALGVPDYVLEVLMNLLQAYSEASLKAESLVRVSTGTRPSEVVIQIDCDSRDGARNCGVVADPRIEAAGRRLESMGGRFSIVGSMSQLLLPRWNPQASQEALPPGPAGSDHAS